MLTFNADTHRYELDGAPVPSVTGVISPLNDFGMIPKDVLARAAAYGTAVHKMCALEATGLLDYGTLDEGLLPALEAFGSWKADYPALAEKLHGPWTQKEDGSFWADRVCIEAPMGHKKFMFAGTGDIVFFGEMIIDIKTRKPNPLTDAIQCAAYEKLAVANGITGHPKGYEHRILYLALDGSYEFVKVNHRDAWNRFRFLLDHHNAAKTIQSWRAK